MRKIVQKNSNKIYWLSLLATVLLSYGFLLTQVSVGIDDEAYGNYYGGDSLAAQGRVGYILVRFFADIYEFTPVWRELLGILIFVGVVSIFIRLFQEHSSGRFQTTASTILVLLTLSYPLLSERFLFSECVFSTPLQWLLCAGGIICLLAAHRETGSRRIPWLLGALAAIGGAMLFEKTVAAACATMAIQVALVTQLNEESPYYRQGKKLMQLAGMLAGTFVGGVLISAGGTAALRALVGQTNSGYVDRYDKYDISSPLMSLAWCLKTVAERIVKSYRQGTHFGIHMDEDGLIMAGQELDQVTWMDVRVGEFLPTPRHGKPVEINAYWYNALQIMACFSEILGKEGAEYEALAKKAKEAFCGQFWMEDRHCLKDVLSGTEADCQVRCNQIWAVSMPFTMLDREKERQVVETVFEKLYTPYGLRTLEKSDPQFHGTYGGPMQQRDMAYHQGTVWTFPLGAYYLSYLKVHSNSGEAKETVREQLEVLASALREGCVGQLPEIYDGENPTSSKGCFAQAWSVGELLRVFEKIERGN